jgi:hypothetical protein
MQMPINAARDAMYVSAQFLAMSHSLTTYRLLRNYQQSPLLRLPPELRNRIYELVLGGQEIRIVSSKPNGGTYPFAIKSRPLTSQDKSINETTKDDDDEFEMLWELKEPIPPRWTTPKHFLALTAPSWQLHNETALLPFGLNEFGGRCFSRFNSFLDLLQPQQRNAIAKVRVMIQDIYSKILRTSYMHQHGLVVLSCTDYLTNRKMIIALRSRDWLECVVVEKWRDITRVAHQNSEQAAEKVDAVVQGRDVKVWVKIVAWVDA